MNEVQRLASAAVKAGGDCVSLLEQLRKALENQEKPVSQYAALTVAEHCKAIRQAMFQVSFLEGVE